MSALKSILRQSRVGLAIFGATAVLGLAANLGLAFFIQKSTSEVTVVKSEKAALEADLSAKLADLKLFQQSYRVFENLKQQGVVGNVDRDNWVSELVNVHRRAGLPDTLAYDLLAPRPVDASNATTTLAPVEIHDLEFSLDDIHELELIKFLGTYQSQVKGRYRLQSCALSSPTSSGLNAKCHLYFFNQPTPPASAARSP